MESKKRVALEVIDEACETYQCGKVFALLSGGDDSVAALRVAVEHPGFVAAVHINTGFGVEATREYVRDLCRTMRCPLIEYLATENVTGKGEPDPQVYEEMVLGYGFPGPTKVGHGKMYNRLKDRGIRRLLREHTDLKEKVVLASGCRSDESARRMGHAERIHQGEPGLEHGEPRVREPRRVWVNHILDWTKADTLAFRVSCGLPRNPVAALIGKSGECLCGAYAKEGELEQLLSHGLTRPAGLRIVALEKRVRAAGFPWGWEGKPPPGWQRTLEGEALAEDLAQYGPPGPMCPRCETTSQFGGSS